MKKLLVIISLILLGNAVHAQKVDSICFHLYTDSLKKGFYNYINVDGKLANGQWQPLDSTTIRFTSNTGFFKGNDLFIDSSYAGETVHVRATLKANPQIFRETIIHIRKRGFDEPLKTNEEILDDMKKGKRKKSKG